jgi:hypothetical protein
MINPQRRKLLDVHVGGNLGRVIGLTELFSESSEPSFDEVPPEDFLALFPPGPIGSSPGHWMVPGWRGLST